MGTANNSALARIQELLPGAVLIPIPLGKKAPTLPGWQKFTIKDTLTPQFQNLLRMVERRGGNIGVLLGPSSNNLTAIDVDRDQCVSPFLGLNPRLDKTLRTRGSRGCQLWLRVSSNYPAKIQTIKSKDGITIGEFRGSGQSVAFGLHPSGKRYQYVVEAPPIEIAFDEIQWPDDWLLPWMAEARNGNKEADFEWCRKFAGDFTTLNLVGLFEELGHHAVGVDGEPTKFSVRCPWIGEHTTQNGALDAVVWQDASRWPEFHCLHAHCAERGLREVLEWAEERKKGIVDRHCARRGFATVGASLIEYAERELDHSKTLLGNRWLCRGSGIFIPAPSGIGKSVLVAQASAELACGRASFGIKPSKELRSLVLQSEDDEGDLIEMAQVVYHLKFTEQELRLVAKNTHFETVNLSGENFLGRLPWYLEKFKPDILWLNPYSAFAPPIMDEGANNRFLREGLTPTLVKFNCGAIIPHHTPKTQFRETTEWSFIDFSYAGAGWAVMTNWARGILAIEPFKGLPHLFKFISAKRGERIGWGERIQYFAHSDVAGQLLWVPATPEEVAAAEMSRKKDPEVLLGLIPPGQSILKNDLIILASNKFKIGRDRTIIYIKSLLARKAIEEVEVPQERARPAIAYRRSPLHQI